MFGVAQRGFDAFTRRFESAIESAPRPSRAAFLHVGRAVLAFALEHPVLYRVMFSGIKAWTVEELAQAPSETAFGRMLVFVRELQRARVFRRGDVTRQAVAIWSMTHGLATLALSGTLPNGGPAFELADALHTTLLDGLAARGR